MKKIVTKRKDIAFYLKLFPLKMHPDSYWKSKSIICNKSLKLLEDNFEKKTIVKTDCNTTEIDDNLKFGEKNGVSGTPTIIFPDGSARSEAMDAEKMIKLIDEAVANSKPAEGKRQGNSKSNTKVSKQPVK